MRKWLVALILGSVMILGACGGDSQDELTQEEKIYKKNCAACHGQNLDGGAGPSLEGIGSKYNVDEIIDIIENGTGDMRPQKQVAEDDRVILAEWLVNGQ